MRVTSLKTLRLDENYLAAIQFFEITQNDKEIDSSASTKAAGFLKSIESFDFFYLLNINIEIFERIERLNAELQKNDLCINMSHEMVKDVTAALQKLRETQFDDIWDKIVKEAADLSLEEPHLERKRRRNKKYEHSTSEDHTFAQPIDYYRHIFYQILDQVLMSLQDRFDNETLNFLNACENFITGKDEKVDLQKIVHFFNGCVSDDDAFDLKRLSMHRDFFLEIISKDVTEDENHQIFTKSVNKNCTNSRSKTRKESSVDSLKDVVDILKRKSSILGLIPEFTKFIKVLLVIPGSSCTCERSFSTLRRLKTYLRAQMTQQRLNNIAVLNIYREDAASLMLNEIINEFICMNSLRRSTFLLK